MEINGSRQNMKRRVCKKQLHRHKHRCRMGGTESGAMGVVVGCRKSARVRKMEGREIDSNVLLLARLSKREGNASTGAEFAKRENNNTGDLQTTRHSLDKQTNQVTAMPPHPLRLPLIGLSRWDEKVPHRLAGPV